MKRLAYALAAAVGIAIASGTLHSSGNSEPTPRDPVEAMRAECALWLHFAYDQERCLEILEERVAKEGTP